MKRNIMGWLFLLWGYTSFGQPLKEVVIFVEPNNAKVLLDGELFPNKTKASLSHGTHVVKTWAPHRLESVDTFHVDQNTNSYSKGLLFNEPYRDYLRAEYKYLLNKAFQTNLFLIVSGISLGMYGNSLLVHGEHENNAEEYLVDSRIAYSRYIHSKTVGDVNRYKEEYNVSYQGYLEALVEQNKHINRMNYFGTLCLVTGAATYITYRRFKVMKKKLVKPKIERPAWVY